MKTKVTNFNVTTPCDDCPFRRVGGVRVGVSRIKEIANQALTEEGKTFGCHKTTGLVGKVPKAGVSHCAGALILARKQNVYPRIIRIAIALGLYSPEKLTGANEVADNADELVALNKGR